MTKHPTSVEGFDGTMEELAKHIAGMCYDSFSKFLSLVAEEVHQEAKQDSEAGHTKVGGSLYEAMRALRHAAQAIDKAQCV